MRRHQTVVRQERIPLHFPQGGNCPLDTWTAGVAPSFESVALVVLYFVRPVSTAPLFQSTKQNIKAGGFNN